MSSELDRYDWELIKLLAEDAFLTNSELSEKIFLSPSQCSRRRKRLQEAGVITGYRACVNLEKVGYHITSFVYVTLLCHSDSNHDSFRDLVLRNPEIVEAYSISGDEDYMLKICIKSLKDMSRIINKVLLSHNSVKTVKSKIVFDDLKSGTGLPI